MQKKGFTIIEVIAVFLIILGTTFFILPIALDNTKQARFISQWTETYTELEYIASAIKAQDDATLKKKFEKAKDNEVIGAIVLSTVKPYLRIKKGVAQSDYHQNYMNKDKVTKGAKYYFDDFYLTDANQIVGLKWLNKDCKEKTTCGVLTFDLNGFEPPNTWGKDIFGINILENGIEPIGKGTDSTTLSRDCSRSGAGVYCSYFYIIGGDFD
jgi:type II secretory pathway pseudopilin PulG